MIQARTGSRSSDGRKGLSPTEAGPFLFYLLIVTGMYPLFRHLVGSDSISYISIARHYLDGYWWEAINTNWSPLFSWLMTPLLAIGAPGLLASKLVFILSGIGVLYGLRRLSRSCELSAPMRFAVLYTAAVMTAAFALVRLSPDMTVAAILLVYWSIVLDRDYASLPRGGLQCGLLGALGFLAKGYIFYFFLAHFFLLSLLHWVRSDQAGRIRVRRQFAVGLAVFFVGCAPWICAMSAKSGALTLGSTGAFNYRLVGPQSPGYPQYYGLIPPPSPHAISMWESPSPNLLPQWSPFASLSNLRHQILLSASNVKLLLALLVDASPLSIAALFAYLVWALARPDTARYPWPLVLITVVLLPAGYLLVYIQDRYIFSIFLVLLLLGCTVIDHTTLHLRTPARMFALAGFALSFLILPVRLMVGQRNSGKNWYEVGRAISEAQHIEGRLASCGAWNDSLAVAFYLNVPFYGSTGMTAEEELVRSALNPSALTAAALLPATEPIASQLHQHQITHYLVWPSCRVVPPAGLLLAPVGVPEQPGVRLYRVSEDVDIHRVERREDLAVTHR